MRFKVVLFVNKDVYGNVLPINYQSELINAVKYLIKYDKANYQKWLTDNGISNEKYTDYNLFSVSNLYISKLHVCQDRLSIQLPRIQFWISFHHEINTEAFLAKSFLNKEIVISDNKSAVSFSIESIETLSPIKFEETMLYQSISPITVSGLNEYNVLNWLEPNNPYFAQFMFEELIERWEKVNKKRFDGSREFSFRLLAEPKRKTSGEYLGRRFVKKCVSYMLKFEITMDVRLQEIAFDLGIGDKVSDGYGYLELLYREKTTQA